VASPSPAPGEHTGGALADWGLSPAEIAGFRADGAVL
jgi:crotonobetainyl-CoA:carnitine CoA-transferase CaiB-like acyl-CoA transferase